MTSGVADAGKAGSSLEALCREMAGRAQAASRRLATARGEVKDRWLRRAAERIREQAGAIAEGNAKDVAYAHELGLTSAAIDRLTLTPKRIEEIARALEEVATLPDPVGEVVAARKLPSGLDVSQVRVPLGVVLMIYESRPNVTADAAAICVKSGNAVILRGGKESLHSNLALHGALAGALADVGLPADAVQVVPTSDREAVGMLLKAGDLIDLAIPRGGKSLIERVAREASMPVLKHYDGVCHVYVDANADEEEAVAIAVNAKAQRPGTCNAAETLLVHEAVAPSFLPKVAAAMAAEGVELRGDERSRRVVPAMKPAAPGDFGHEFLEKILAVAVVDSLDAAVDHIAKHGSKHTDAILTRDLSAARRFVAEVDSAAVVVNASTRLNDGGQLGLGAEIGISTDKFHARGPCGLRELTSVKWVVYGDGHLRT